MSNGVILKRGKVLPYKVPALQMPTHMPIYSRSVLHSLPVVKGWITHQKPNSMHTPVLELSSALPKPQGDDTEKKGMVSSFPTSTITVPILSRQPEEESQGVPLASVVESLNTVMVLSSYYIVN